MNRLLATLLTGLMLTVSGAAIGQSPLPLCQYLAYPLHNCQGALTRSNGDKYVGGFKDNMPNGHGTYTFSNGRKYVGEFKDGKFDGQGTLFAANGSVSQSGTWAGDKFVGTTSWLDPKKPEAWPEPKVNGIARDVHIAGQETIAMEKDGGVYVVPVRLNDTITLNAVVDSGASDVSIPADIVLTLMRTKTVSVQDFLGKQTYVLADGSKVPSQRFRIRSLKVGNNVIENVVASIASVDADILLGQSFLGRFKSWSVDNEQHTLILK